MPIEISFFLELNCSSHDKTEVAIKKILRHQRYHFDVQPFFEWDLKVLPFVVHWVDRARAYTAGNISHTTDIDGVILTAMYQFARAMPMQFVPISQRTKVKKSTQY